MCSNNFIKSNHLIWMFSSTRSFILYSSPPNFTRNVEFMPSYQQYSINVYMTLQHSQCRNTNTKGGDIFIYYWGVLDLLYFQLVGIRGHLNYIWEEGGTLYFVLSTHPVFFRLIKVATGQLWHSMNFIYIFFKYNFQLVYDQ